MKGHRKLGEHVTQGQDSLPLATHADIQRDTINYVINDISDLPRVPMFHDPTLTNGEWYIFPSLWW